jgi:hypothetical protein
MKKWEQHMEQDGRHRVQSTFKELARLAGFKVTKESSGNEIFHLEMQKQI